MTDKQLTLALSNLKEIVLKCPGTYAAYVAQTTIDYLEE